MRASRLISARMDPDTQVYRCFAVRVAIGKAGSTVQYPTPPPGPLFRRFGHFRFGLLFRPSPPPVITGAPKRPGNGRAPAPEFPGRAGFLWFACSLVSSLFFKPMAGANYWARSLGSIQSQGELKSFHQELHTSRCPFEEYGPEDERFCPICVLVTAFAPFQLNCRFGAPICKEAMQPRLKVQVPVVTMTEQPLGCISSKEQVLGHLATHTD